MIRPGHTIGVVGDLCMDLLVRGDVVPRYHQEEQWVEEYELAPGGSGAIFAGQCAKLGHPVKLAGLIGADHFGDILRRELAANGIPLEDIHSSPTGKTPLGLGLLRPSGRAMLTCAGTYAEITGEWVRRTGLLDGVGHLHLCSYFLLAAVRPSWEETLPWLRKKGVTVSLDTNWDPAEEWDGLEALWPHVDVFLPNAQEALAISRETTVAAAARYFEKHLPLTVIKDGADGAWLCRGGGPEHFPVPPDLLAEAPVVDTTGAGDSFDAGFMTAWLDGASPADCMARALRCGTRSTQRMGGLKGQWIPGRPDEATERHAREGY